VELILIWSNAASDTSREQRALELAEMLFSLSRRHAQPFSVLALRVRTRGIGIDRAALEGRVADELRQTDVLARWGDDSSWVVFCPSTTSEGAKELAQRILARLEGRDASAGAASFREDALTLPDLVEAAWARLGATYGADPTGPPDGPASGVRRDAAYFVRPSWRRRFGARIKRLFDLGAVLAAAPLWAPLAALCAAAIKLSDPGAPVLFRQERTGRGGRRFQMLKFRTMVPDAEERKAELAHLNQLAWPDFKIPEDPRVTWLGRILRKASLDELPQLFNVLRGEMSLVGPRPTSFAPETYEAWHTARLDVPPGVTGLWQIEGRTSTEFDERLRLDIEYVRHQGFLYDLGILLRTVPVVLTARGGH